jgi:beta-phosphoglucomutase-like phosphatase (HAD superfamily)
MDYEQFTNLLKTKTTFIFDLDGTLIDSLGMWNEVDARLVEAIGGNRQENIPNEREIYLRENTSGDIFMGYANYLKERYNSVFSKEEINALRNKISKEYLRHFINYKPRAAEVLWNLKKMGKTLILATIGSQWVIDIYRDENLNIKNEANFDDVFDLILSKDQVSKKKPDPEVYLTSALLSSKCKEECLVIEDSLSGVMAAKNAEMDAVKMYDQYSEMDSEEIDKLVCYGFENYYSFLNVLLELDKKQKLVLEKK